MSTPDVDPAAGPFAERLGTELRETAMREYRARQGRYLVEIVAVDGDVKFVEAARTRRGAYTIARSMRSPLYDVVIYKRGREIDRFRHTPPRLLLP